MAAPAAGAVVGGADSAQLRPWGACGWEACSYVVAGNALVTAPHAKLILLAPLQRCRDLVTALEQITEA